MTVLHGQGGVDTAVADSPSLTQVRQSANCVIDAAAIRTGVNYALIESRPHGGARSGFARSAPCGALGRSGFVAVLCLAIARIQLRAPDCAVARPAGRDVAERAEWAVARQARHLLRHATGQWDLRRGPHHGRPCRGIAVL